MRQKSGMRRLIAVMAMTTALVISMAPAALAATYNFSYDGCDWKLDVDGLGYTARTTDKNGGCSYLTTKSRDLSFPASASAGPSNVPYLTVSHSHNVGNVEGRGKITTWEHGWTQDSGWRDD